MFKDQTNVVPIIAPLNECVVIFSCLMSDHPTIYRPAGFDGQDVLNTVRQYWYDSYGNIRWALFFGGHVLSLIVCRFPYGTSQQSNTVVLLHDAFQPLRSVLLPIGVNHFLQRVLVTGMVSKLPLAGKVSRWTPIFTRCSLRM